MKSVSLFVLVCLISFVEFTIGQSVDNEKNDYMKNMKDCKTKISVSKDFAENYDIYIAVTKDEGCFVACMEKANGFINETNKFNIENIQNVFSVYSLKDNQELSDKLLETYKLCNEQSNEKTDECDAAQTLLECVIPKKTEVLNNMNVTMEDFRTALVSFPNPTLTTIKDAETNTEN